MEDKSKIPILKVGDKIRIKSKEWFDSQDKTVYGSIAPPKGQPCYFSHLMSKYCGEICTIKQIRSSPNTVKVNENIYNWDSWMFDIVESAHEYKVGDKVRIKSKEWYNSQPKDKDRDIIPPEGYLLYFFRSMQMYCGEVYTIESISTNDHLINFKEDNRSWESWMFDPVDEEERSIGDIIQFPSNSRYIIIDIVPKSKFYTTVEMSSGEVYYIDKTKSHTFVGKYLSDIDTKLNIIDRATLVRKRLNTIIEIGDAVKDKEVTKKEFEQLRAAHLERWAKLIAISFISKDNNSQSNFSKFDLSKVMYKSKIIK